MLRSTKVWYSLGLSVLLCAPIVADAAWAQSKVDTNTTTATDTGNSATQKARERSKADELAEEEARKARAERESRVPTLVEEQKRDTGKVDESPALKYEQFRRQIEVKMAGKRKDLLDDLDAILQSKPSEEEKPEILFQKAELYLEESQYHFFEGMRTDDAVAIALDKGDDEKVLELQDKKDKQLADAKSWTKGAIKIFDEIQRKYPKFDRMPDVLYSLGRALWDGNEYRDALKVYRKMIKDYPTSQYISDAWLAFGEYYFQIAPDDERDVRKALDAYEKAAQNQDSQVFGYAVYKQGWCHYNLVAHEKAAEKFKEVILYSDLNADLLGERKIALAREARKDYVLAYSHYGTGQSAPAEFKKIAENKELRRMLERLSDIFYADGKDRDAIILYQYLMKEQPDNIRNGLYQAKVVKLANRIGEKKQVVAQAKKMVEEYTRAHKNADAKKYDKDDAEVVEDIMRETDNISDNTLRYLATSWHNEAKKTKEIATFDNAHEIYKYYLQLFGKKKEAYEMRFFYAELLFILEKFEDAADEYVSVYKSDPKGKWAESAAEESVRAFEEVSKDFDKKNKDKPVDDTDLREKTLPPIKKKYVDACKDYIDNFPGGKNIIEVKYKIARTLYDYNHFTEAVPRFMEIVENHAGHPRAEQAATLVLDTYSIVENWEKLYETADIFVENKALMKSKDFVQMINRVREESGFKRISDYEKKQQWDEAAQRYYEFGRNFPQSPLADRSLGNAAAMYTRAGQLEKAIEVRLKLIKEYPSSDVIPEQIYSIGASYEQIVDYKNAAQWFEKFADGYEKDPRAKDALFNASIYREGLGDVEKAITDRERYLKLYGDSKEAVDIAYSIPLAWENSGNNSKAIAAYLKFADDWQNKNAEKSLQARYWALKLAKQGKTSSKELDKMEAGLAGAVRKLEKTDGKPTGLTADAIAYVAFSDVEKRNEQYKKITIASADKPDKFKASLDEKNAALDALEKAYTDVVKIGSAEWAVASLYRIGEAYTLMADAIRKVAPPKGLTEQQIELFRGRLDERLLPVEERADENMILCIETTNRLSAFNEWSSRCLSYLEEKRPERFPKNDEESIVNVVMSNPQKAATEKPMGLVLVAPKNGERPHAQPDLSSDTAAKNNNTNANTNTNNNGSKKKGDK